MKQVLMFAALLFSLAVFAQEGQAPNSSAVKPPCDFSLWYYPDSFNGRRGLRLDVFEITNAQDGSVTAKATMHGRGLDGCTIRSTLVTGKIANQNLVYADRSQRDR
jgi:hypothetical protein